MNLTIDHPTGRDNFTEVTIGDLTVWFSYRTPVAFMYPGEGRVVAENEWGPTTGKHLNYVKEGKADRIPRAEFLARLDAIVAREGLTV
jgi:hypothetical protein